MEYRKIPYVDKPVSRILFGTAMSPFLEGGDGSALLDAIYGTGVTAFDTARQYEGAEQSLGKWIAKRHIRERVVILSKCGHPSVTWEKRVNEKELREDLKESLHNLQTNYIDIYLLHRDDPNVEVKEVVEVFNAMHEEGKIGAFGGSNWTHERIEEANEYAYKHSMIPFSVSSPNYGLADQKEDPWGGGCVTISGPAHADARKWYEKNKMPVVAYSSLGRGLFSGRLKSEKAAENAAGILDEFALKGYGCPDNYERLRRCEELAARKQVSVSQIAMAFIFSQNMNTLAVVSTSSAERMQSNVDALHVTLSEEEMAYLDLQK